MAIKLKKKTIILNEATGRNTYIHYVLEIDGQTPVKIGRYVYNIIGLDWNDAGTSQELVADNGQRFRPGDIAVDSTEQIVSCI